VIVFGWGGGRPQDFGPAMPGTCANCRNDTYFHYVKSSQWFRVFFVPVFRYQREDYLLCGICTRGMSLQPEESRLAKDLTVAHAARTSGAITDDEYARRVAEFRNHFRPIEIVSDLGHPPPEIDDAELAEIGRQLQALDPALDGEWRPDPSGRHDLRYWDRVTSWTAYVSDGGITDSDPVLTPPSAGWYPDPALRREERYWSGGRWTEDVRDAGVDGKDPLT
jgi:hypothetical protein